MANKWLRVGLILKPQGVMGEVKVLPLTDDPHRFEAAGTLMLEPTAKNGEFTGLSVTSVRIDPKEEFVYLRLEGVNDRNSAEALRDRYLCVDRAHAVRLPRDRYFICDLEGCTVVNLQGETVGVLSQVLQPGAQDVYVVKGAREWLIPAVKAFVKKVDIEAGVITVDTSALEEEEV